jgi:hypothetical protein
MLQTSFKVTLPKSCADILLVKLIKITVLNAYRCISPQPQN